MPPPATRTPRYVPRRRRRSAGDLLIGLLAIAALVALTVGVPFALVTVFGLPVPHAMPSLALLTHRLDLPALLKVLSLLVWVAWIQLVWCVIAEIRAAVRNAGMPRRVPLAGGTQALVHRLVSTALLVFAATAALSPALAHQPLAAPHSVTAAGGRSAGSAAQPGGGKGTPGARYVTPPLLASPPQLAPSPRAAAPAPRAAKLYVVKPPAGRFHESLWEIAQKYLGDGRRYREIFDLNKDRVQPDGTRLTIASLIRPGWVLHMPRDAHGPGIEVIPAGDSRPAGDGQTAAGGPGRGRGPGPHLAAPRRGTQPGRGTRPDRRTRPDRAARPRRGSRRLQGSRPPRKSRRPRRARPPRRAWPPWRACPRRGARPRRGAGPSSGVCSHPAAVQHQRLSRRRPPASRRPQLPGRAGRGGAPGHRAAGRPGPPAPRAAVAARLRPPGGRSGRTRGAGRIGPAGRGQRAVGPAAGPRAALPVPARCALEGRTPPAVVAAHLSHENLDLWVAPADLDAPAPWTAVGDGQVWRLPFTALGRVDVDEAGDALALFPGLVSLGADHTGRVLVNLEAAHGLISVTGPEAMTAAVLSAMAMELATSRWSDRMRITLAGFGDDLVALAPDRITAVPTVEEALPALEAHAAGVAEAMAASGVSSALAGRSLGADPDAWTPHYLISAVPPSPWERSRLLALARSARAAAAGYVVAGDVPGAAWTWEVTPEGRLLAGELGFDVQAQLVQLRQHEALVDLFTAAARPEGVALAPPPPNAAPPQHLEAGHVMPVEITILGPASVQAPGVLEPDRVALATELVIYLAVHPGGVHPNVLSAALWPRGVAADVRDAAVARVTAWLGTDSIGRPHLAADASGRLRLGSGVRVDWQVFLGLAGHAELALLGSAEQEDYLGRALDLVQGQLLDGLPPGRYAWLASDELEYEVTARVADTAHQLVGLRLASGDPEGAMDAARAGLRLAWDDELLWRDLLRAAHQTGQEELLRAVVDEVCARTALDEVLPRMAPETESLIDDLYPSWRSTVP